MRKWQSLGGLVVLSSLVACATATTGAAGGDSGGSDGLGGGGEIVNPVGGNGSLSAGTGSVAAGTTSTGGQSAFGGSSGIPSGGKAGQASTGGAGAHPGGSSGTSSGGTSSGTAGTSSTAGAAGGTSTGPCANPMDVTGGHTADLGAGDVCLRTMDKFNNVGCSSFEGRTLKVNGMPATCGVAATYTPIGGYNYLEVSAGGATYASLNWFCTLMTC
jgi:hypothetical protein